MDEETYWTKVDETRNNLSNRERVYLGMYGENVGEAITVSENNYITPEEIVRILNPSEDEKQFLMGRERSPPKTGFVRETLKAMEQLGLVNSLHRKRYDTTPYTVETHRDMRHLYRGITEEETSGSQPSR